MSDPEPERAPPSNRRPLALLAAGALLGLLLAAVGVLRPSSVAPPDDAVARVGDRLIRSESFERAWRVVAADKRNPMIDADRAHVLRRLIEEELLIQRGEAVGLIDSDPSVRRAISAAMIQSIVAESEAQQPDEAALRRFYQENRRYFTPPSSLHVRQIVFLPRPGEGEGGRRDRASAARVALQAGVAFAEVRERYGDVPLVPIPDTALPAHKLQQYIGPGWVEHAQALEPLEFSAPIEPNAEPGGVIRILQLLEAIPGEAPPFEETRAWVEGAYQRDAADRALRDALARLWSDADIALSPEAALLLGEDGAATR